MTMNQPPVLVTGLDIAIPCFLCIICVGLFLGIAVYARNKMIDKLADIWFKNKRMNYRREDKLYKEGRLGEKQNNKPVLTQRELNDLIIKKFMK